MIFGFHFNADSGELSSSSWTRSSFRLRPARPLEASGRAGSGWMRKADGTLDERVEEANVAKRADTAGRLYAPVKLSCLGVVSGVVEIDGSKDVLLSLSGTAGLDGHHRRSHQGTRKDPSHKLRRGVRRKRWRWPRGCDAYSCCDFISR